MQPKRLKADTKNIVGQRFGHILVLSYARSNNAVFWNCVCDCGKKKVICGAELRREGFKGSCGWDCPVRLRDEFWNRKLIDETNGCWNWTGALDTKDGYGVIHRK